MTTPDTTDATAPQHAPDHPRGCRARRDRRLARWCARPGRSRVPHTPVWFMRQAGRSLPEYRTVREGVGMLESCRRPDLVTEITLQPVRRHGVDAAIFFSDIVVPLSAIGVDLDIVAGVGPGRRPPDPLARRPRPAARPHARRRPRHHRVGAPAHRRARVDPAHRLRRRAVHPGLLPRRGRAVEEPRAHQGADAGRPAAVARPVRPARPDLRRVPAGAGRGRAPPWCSCSTRGPACSAAPTTRHPCSRTRPPRSPRSPTSTCRASTSASAPASCSR